MRKQASVLVGLLWCLALLALVVVGTLHHATLDLRVAKNYGDQIQARYLALAGTEKAKALLYHEAWDRRGSRTHHSGKLYDDPEEFKDVPLGRGTFSVFRQGSGRGLENYRYGVADEESRVNVNVASDSMLTKLYGLTEETAAAILDYRDRDHAARQGGAEAEQYAALSPPYLPRNDPLPTPRELLMVLGVDPESFWGEDINQNGLLDPGENDGNVSYPNDNQDGVLDPGWSAWVTVDSKVRNINAAGQARVNIREADESALAAVPGLTTDLARAIVRYRDDNRLESLVDLLEVTAPRPNRPNAANNAPSAANPSRSPATGRSGSARTTANRPSDGSPAGPKLISEQLLIEIADDLTVTSDLDQPGAININTAGVEVLACVPGIDRPLAQSIVSHRQSAGFFPNVARLLEVPGLTANLLEQAAPHLTVRSETFRILSEGRISTTGASRRLEVVVHIGASYVETLAYREDDL